MVLGIADTEPLEFGRKPALDYLFMNQQCCAYRSHNLMVGRYNYLGAEFLSKSLYNAFVEGYSALESYRGLDLFPQADIVDVVAHQGLAQSIDNVLDAISHLLFVNHVRFGENGASPRNVNRVLALQCPLAELRDTHI